jgi:tetratricopeptide (TPR) repeat protein
MLTQRRSAPWRPAAFILAACLAAPSFGGEGLRQVHVGDAMPEFKLADAKGTTFDYRHERARVLGVVILQAGQNHLERLIADVEALAEKLRSEAGAFDCVGVMSGPGASEYLRSRAADAQAAFPVLADPNFAFWGKLGVIAAPTAVVVGADHKLQWVKAGYGYDFVAGFHAQLNKALGLDGSADASVRVETLENTSSRARRDRHIQLARTLARKGRFDSAIQELEKLRQLDPNAVDAALELGEVLCRAGRNEAALKTVAEVKAETNQDKAHALLVGAWARRQIGELDAAESLLSKALELEPESPRILYELGKVHQAKGDAEKALACYRRALAEVFGDTASAEPSQK